MNLMQWSGIFIIINIIIILFFFFFKKKQPVILNKPNLINKVLIFIIIFTIKCLQNIFLFKSILLNLLF